MRGASRDTDADGITARQNRSWGSLYLASRTWHDVLCKAHIRAGQLVDESIGNHALCPIGSFFCWLEKRDESARPLSAQRINNGTCTKQGSSVHIGTAGMHIAISGSEIHAGFFGDKQSIKITAHQHCRTFGVTAENCCHAKATDAGDQLTIKLAQLLLNLCCGAFFVVRKLRMLV